MLKRQKNAEVLKKKLILKSLFKRVVREIIMNTQWLEGDDDQKISANVKRNIALLVRPKRKVGLLTSTVRI